MPHCNILLSKQGISTQHTNSKTTSLICKVYQFLLKVFSNISLLIYEGWVSVIKHLKRELQFLWAFGQVLALQFSQWLAVPAEVDRTCAASVLPSVYGIPFWWHKLRR